MDYNKDALDYLQLTVERKLNINFTIPKLYKPKELVNGRKRVTLKKRWYVYYYYRNPKTKKKDLFKIYKHINNLPTIEERIKFGNEICSGMLRLLRHGYNPYEKKIESFKGAYLSNTNELKEQIKNEPYTAPASTRSTITLESALNNALKVKKTSIKSNTYSGYKNRVENLLDWLKENDKKEIELSNFNFQMALDYINHIRQKNVSATSVDNTRRELSAIFRLLKSDRLIPENYFAEIETYKSSPKRHKVFTIEQLNDIKKYLLNNDLNLYYFITVMMYSFLRNIEVVRLKVKDIDLKNNVLCVETKTENVTYKLLDEKVVNLLVNVYDIENRPKEDYIFTQDAGITGKWNATEKHKRKYFSEKFKDMRTALGYDEDYTLYGFRHTMISDIYKNLILSGMNQQEAIVKTMSITGHSSQDALKKYLRSIGALLPKKYISNKTIDF